ncbi:MAG: response regulator [Deltaproteobacteria bacterium]|nr:response regulator [Deltaproteobacteria bacterium]MBW2322766.1 response regulator [Deltaproteobacteria bacterium]
MTHVKTKEKEGSQNKIIMPGDPIEHTSNFIAPRCGNRILIVEDELVTQKMIKDYLLKYGYQVVSVSNVIDANELMAKEEFDLIITDMSIPQMDGIALRKAARNASPLTPVILLSDQGTLENAIQAIQMGAHDFVIKPIVDFKPLKTSIDRALDRKSFMALQDNYQSNLEILVAQQTQELIEKQILLQEYADQLEEVSISIISSLQVALEEKDKYTAGHSRRVTDYSQGIARHMGLSEKEIRLLSTAAQLHDIGKLMIDLSFMNRPGPLSEEEWTMMKKHPVVADRILSPLPFLDEVRPIIRHHHERLDGSGYPDGLVGDQVDKLTQILAVADSFDAMTSSRSYRALFRPEAALAELRRCAGQLYCVEVLDGLVAYLEYNPKLFQK